MASDATAWLGDPIGICATERGGVVISAPPGERSTLVISVFDAPSVDEPATMVDGFVRIGLREAYGVRDALHAAIAQLEEHAEPPEPC